MSFTDTGVCTHSSSMTDNSPHLFWYGNRVEHFGLKVTGEATFPYRGLTWRLLLPILIMAPPHYLLTKKTFLWGKSLPPCIRTTQSVNWWVSDVHCNFVCGWDWIDPPLLSWDLFQTLGFRATCWPLWSPVNTRPLLLYLEVLHPSPRSYKHLLFASVVSSISIRWSSPHSTERFSKSASHQEVVPAQRRKHYDSDVK